MSLTSSNESLKVFMAYQYRHTRLDRIDREYLLSQAVTAVNASLKGSGLPYSATWQRLDLESWHTVGSQILGAIDASTIFIADISELNANVLFELGVAIGLAQRNEKFRVHVLAHESLDIRSLPSDFLGSYVVQYTADTFEPIIARLIRDSVERLKPTLINSAAELEWQELWGIRSASAVDIICSEIPENERPNFAAHDHPNYLRYAKFADLDSLVFLHELCATQFPGVSVRDYGAEEAIAQHATAIMVGGAAWNSRVQRLQEYLPLRFVDAKNPETDSLIVEVSDFKMIFESIMSTSGIPIADYFLFARLCPDGRSCLLLFAGGLTHGVLGGIKTFGHVSPGVTNAQFLRSATEAAPEIIAIGRIEHRDGYLKVPDFSRTSPCLVLRRKDCDSHFSPVIQGCACDLHRPM